VNACGTCGDPVDVTTGTCGPYCPETIGHDDEEIDMTDTPMTPEARAEAWTRMLDGKRAALVARAADRRSHREYLATLLACSSWDEANEAREPRGITGRAADALLLDAAWLIDAASRQPWAQDLPGYPDEYETHRRTGERAAASTRAARARRAAEVETAPAAITDRLSFLR
jgi:hypothetical protein